MSPNVGNFVHDLVEMAKAMETLPQVQAELEHVNAELNAAANTITDRELRILDLKSQIEALNEKVHASEVAKDAAETMFLEADDRTQRALAFVKTTFGNAGALIQALEPPKPTDAGVQVQAMPEAAPVAEDTAKDVASPPMHEAQLEGTKVTGWEERSPLPLSQEQSNASAPADNGITTTQGQSESPLPPSDATSESVPSQASVSENVIHTADAPSAPSSIDLSPAIGKPQPYVGKRYMNVPGFISKVDWLEGGGTEEDYYWRAGRPA